MQNTYGRCGQARPWATLLSVAFRPKANRAAVPSDPEQLYRTLAGQDGAPRALWVHQGDVLREWHANFRDASDVAIELPTGAGKTLVGGLVGEWRRRSAHDRVAYMCLTRQLAQQTAENLLSYGIPAVLLTGRVVNWNAADRAKYSSATAIAVTTYTHVFNVNPALNDAHVLLLDDAHSGDGFTASPWSLEIAREDSAFHDVLSLLTDALDPLVLNGLRTTDVTGQYRSSVYLASPAGVAAIADDLEAALQAAAANGNISDAARYVWRLLMGHVDRCVVYVSYRGIQIRPLIPPTGVHEAFDGPRQRIYMSATLGSGGELERAYGRRRIDRIPIPKGWDKQGTGRRFFCCPELTSDVSKDVDSVDAWVADTIEGLRKALVLTPDKRTARVFEERRIPTNMKTMTAIDVEDDLNVFAKAGKGVLLLTNRYDGIDLPDRDCRLVVMQGLPARGDLQERFLYGALGALEVLQERIRARLVQGAGRATRNAGDFAVVVMLGQDLTSFVTRRDVQKALHPEVQAELDFGLRNSLETSSSEMSENIAIFLRHGQEWRDVEDEIAADRDTLNREDPPGAMELQRSAPHEVAACLAAWQGEWDRALASAREAIDALGGGKAPQRYAALWNYLAANWALRLAGQRGDDDLRASSVEYYRAARAAGRGTTWLSHLAAPAEQFRSRSIHGDGSARRPDCADRRRPVFGVG